MAEKMKIYKCEKCGNIVEVLHGGMGALFCCGAEMTEFKEKTEDAGNEKHLPVVEKVEGGVKVKVGDVPHPMIEEHHIQWIEVITATGVYRKELNAGEAPEATFCICEDVISVREYCNLHGLWEKKL